MCALLVVAAQERVPDEPRLFDYPEPASTDEFTAYCDGPPSDNGFYGDGIVNALAAVSKGKH